MDAAENRKRLILFLLAAIFAFYVAENIYGNIFNNYLDQVQKIGTSARGLLELPRELPGVLSVFAISALFFLSEGAIAAVACFLFSAGLFALAVPGFAGNYWLLCLWLGVASFGQHFFMVIVDAIVLHTASPEKRSLRLGQMKSLITAAGLVASTFVWFKWKYVSQNFNIDFIIAGTGAFIAGLIFVIMKPAGHFKKCNSWRDRIVLKKQYSLYYVLEAFFGARKQVFITFGFWLLVFTLGKSPAYIGKLMLISGVIGLGFRPFIGKIIQLYGERRALVTESVLVVLVCLGYAFAMKLFSLETASIILSVCFIADASLFAFGMARSSYLARTVEKKDDLTPSLYSGMAINHVTSIIGAVLGGLLWKFTGDHLWVFLFAAVLGVIYGFFADRVKDGVHAAVL
ncbi:MAG: MFS transporter [Victivallaceae bacterium]|jgi:MFS family permease